MAYHPWHDVELPEDLQDPVPAVIEIPMGSKVKYELDKVSGLLMVDRILFSAVHYPANYGFVPRTFCEDGDPLDILVFCREPIASLALMRANVIGVMKMRDEKGEDDKLIAVHADDPEYESYTDLWQLPPHRLRELKRFFEDYKALERKEVAVSDPLGRREALEVLRKGIELYNERQTELLAKYSSNPPTTPKLPKARKPAARKAPARKSADQGSQASSSAAKPRKSAARVAPAARKASAAKASAQSAKAAAPAKRATATKAAAKKS